MIKYILFKLYDIGNFRIMKYVVGIITRIDGGELKSLMLRELFMKYHKVEIGMYTHGGCFKANNIDKYTVIGRYCSIAQSATVFNRNHPLEFKSTNALFFNPVLNIIKNDCITHIPLKVGNDVWLGHNSIILPNVRFIGDGAVIGAGAVVNKDVPPYAVVVGNPSRIVRYRFNKEQIEKIMKSKWWEKSIEELKPHIKEFQSVLGDSPANRGEGE